jgi:hypothetical protein
MSKYTFSNREVRRSMSAGAGKTAAVAAQLGLFAPSGSVAYQPGARLTLERDAALAASETARVNAERGARGERPVAGLLPAKGTEGAVTPHAVATKCTAISNPARQLRRIAEMFFRAAR